MNINKVMVCGNLTRDPEAKAVGNSTVTKFSIAVNREFKGSDGEKKKEVEFVNIEVWGKVAENVARYLKKGSEAFIEGRLKTDTYEKDGQKRSITKVVADSVQFGAKPRQAEGEPNIPEQAQEAAYGDNGEVPF